MASNPERRNGGVRILGTISNKKCPLGCIYCFVECNGYEPFDRLDIPTSDEIFQQTVQNIQDVDIVQPACDIELFLVPGAMAILQKLAKYNKSISFATKSKITARTAEQLATLHRSLVDVGAILQIAVSITRLCDWNDIEQHVPSPEERIQTLKRLYECGIPTTVAIRPLLPFVPADEIEEIVNLTRQYCFGYLSGPVYVTPRLKEYMGSIGKRYPSQYTHVEWMSGSPRMEVIHSPELESALEARAAQYGLPVFQDNVAAVVALRDKQFLAAGRLPTNAPAKASEQS